MRRTVLHISDTVANTNAGSDLRSRPGRQRESDAYMRRISVRFGPSNLSSKAARLKGFPDCPFSGEHFERLKEFPRQFRFSEWKHALPAVPTGPGLRWSDRWEILDP